MEAHPISNKSECSTQTTIADGSFSARSNQTQGDPAELLDSQGEVNLTDITAMNKIAEAVINFVAAKRVLLFHVHVQGYRHLFIDQHFTLPSYDSRNETYRILDIPPSCNEVLSFLENDSEVVLDDIITSDCTSSRSVNHVSHHHDATSLFQLLLNQPKEIYYPRQYFSEDSTYPVIDLDEQSCMITPILHTQLCAIFHKRDFFSSIIEIHRNRNKNPFPPQKWERGYWRVQVHNWTSAEKLQFWLSAAKVVSSGRIGWVGMTLENSSPDNIRFYCFGGAVRYIWVFLYVMSDRKIHDMCAFTDYSNIDCKRSIITLQNVSNLDMTSYITKQ
ncbi:uncharacterized protein V1516DRAFT_287791 [Lipomyces oligophaga]|uniref:uncharacterized protein n=1 Tax=Lipomyces oligophaga TaxID=45792 RepID=UPI0034CFD8AF